MPVDYKDLLVWQKSIDLVAFVYDATRHFPADERFGLTNQLRRAAVSVPSNIAEGQGRKTNSGFIQFLRIANGSRQEVETQLIIAQKLNFISPDVVADLSDRLAEIGRLLSGLINSLTTAESL
ncbi:MAG: four helix bundle protein [Tepidisphaeraceae bacterium]